MDFKTRYPDFAAIETQIRHARAERSLYLAEIIAGALFAGWTTLRRLFERGDKPWPARDALAKGWVPQD